LGAWRLRSEPCLLLDDRRALDAVRSRYLGDPPGVVPGTYAHPMPADHDRARAAVETAFRAAPLNARRTA
jgi:hypothetical protein